MCFWDPTPSMGFHGANLWWNLQNNVYGQLTWWCRLLNSLAPRRFKVNFRWVIFKLILVVNGWGISCGTALIWVSLDHTYDKSTLVQVMAWCHMTSLGHNELIYPSEVDQVIVAKSMRSISIDEFFKFHLCIEYPYFNVLKIHHGIPWQIKLHFLQTTFSNAFLEWKYMNFD